ncbi:DeoR/GlpR family DNA-binding transcription regulator [Tessaracoccus sp. G1721]
MLPTTRQARILAELTEAGEVRTEHLAEALDCSVETVRRDLAVLERQRRIRRVHGGAVLFTADAVQEPTFDERKDIAADEKRAIAHYLVSQIDSTALVFLDLGTTVAAVVDAFPASFRGTVVTTSLRVAYELARLEHARVLLTGGQLRRGDLSLSGSKAARFLRDLNPDVGIVSAGGVSVEKGITDFEMEETELKRIVLGNARRSYLAVDSSKFGQVAPYAVAQITTPTSIVTGEGIPAAVAARLRSLGVDLRIATGSGADSRPEPER